MPKRKPKFKCKKCNKNFPDNEVIMGCGYFFTENPLCKKCLDTQTILEQLRYNLDKDKLVAVARGKTDRIIYDFRCYDCKEKEEVRKEALKETNERLAKQQEERERADILKAQRLHSSDN